MNVEDQLPRNARINRYQSIQKNLFVLLTKKMLKKPSNYAYSPSLVESVKYLRNVAIRTLEEPTWLESIDFTRIHFKVGKKTDL